jgi:hypothetical protein
MLVGYSNYNPPKATVATTPTTIPVPSSVVGTQGGAYTISVFAQAPGILQPDDMVQMGTSIFVIYQDPHVNPDGTFMPGVTSSQAEVIEYDEKGNVL